MARKWTGIICVEGVQTGDGRVIAPGALTWAELPLPLGYLENQQHGDMSEGGPVVGTIDTITREGADIVATGTLDDMTEQGADIARRMDEGTAPLGNAWGISIDPDNWVVEVVDTTGSPELLDVEVEVEVEADAAAAGHVLARVRGSRGALWTLTAAAGDPDPTDGIVVAEDNVGDMVQRYTSLRIRGATLCAIAAFDQARVVLSPAEVQAPGTPPAVTAAARLDGIPVAPPAAWFTIPAPADDDDPRLVEQYDLSSGAYLGLACPLTIVTDGPDRGLVYGHVGPKDRCHVGIDGVCVTPPMSASGYSHFLLGEVRTAEGHDVPTGPLLVGCDHAQHTLSAAEARDHYAHTGMAWADVSMVDSPYGPWFCGALRPDVTDELVRVLRGGGSVSGDWRGDTGRHELIALQAVSVPGFTTQRVRPLAASARAVDVGAYAPYAIVAAGQVAYSSQPVLPSSAAAPECGCGGTPATVTAGALPDMMELLRVIERRTRPLNAERVRMAASRIDFTPDAPAPVAWPAPPNRR